MLCGQSSFNFAFRFSFEFCSHVFKLMFSYFISTLRAHPLPTMGNIRCSLVVSVCERVFLLFFNAAAAGDLLFLYLCSPMILFVLSCYCYCFVFACCYVVCCCYMSFLVYIQVYCFNSFKLFLFIMMKHFLVEVERVEGCG